jgi:hypothetical protein
VTWYNELTGDWATWEPGEPVQPGAIGFFDEHRRFRHSRTLADLGIVHEISLRDRPGSVLAWSESDVHFAIKVAGQSPAGFEALGAADAGLRFTADREHACVLHMRDLTEACVDDREQILQGIKELLLAGQWDVDAVVVIRRLEARQGFAVVSLGSGQSFEAKAAANAQFAGAADLGKAEFLLAAARGRGSFLFKDFGPGSTPVFSETVRVKQGFWDRLLPWGRDKGTLIGPDGRPFRELPKNLSGYAPQARRYDRVRSAIRPDELSGIAVEDLFEEVTEFPDEGDAQQSPEVGLPGEGGARLVSFPLPVPPGPAALAAADPVEGAPPVVQAMSPDGVTRFALYYRGGGEYWLEVSRNSSAPVPAVVRVRYATTDRGPRELLIPVGGDGSRRPSSVVELRGFAARSWHAWLPVPLASVWSGGRDLVTASVYAAINVAAVRAWDQLASAMPEHVRTLITQILRERGEGPR